jgi:hypothetical protein
MLPALEIAFSDSLARGRLFLAFAGDQGCKEN